MCIFLFCVSVHACIYTYVPAHDMAYHECKVINAAARGRLARRTAKTERALLVLQSCHPLLIRFSLRAVPNRPKVFWYRNKEHLKLLYANYLEFVEKTGYQVG